MLVRSSSHVLDRAKIASTSSSNDVVGPSRVHAPATTIVARLISSIGSEDRGVAHRGRGNSGEKERRATAEEGQQQSGPNQARFHPFEEEWSFVRLFCLLLKSIACTCPLTPARNCSKPRIVTAKGAPEKDASSMTSHRDAAHLSQMPLWRETAGKAHVGQGGDQLERQGQRRD